MAQRKTMTEQQVAILRWIGDGCPDGVMEGTLHRISAGALRNRGLVKTTGRGPSWSATITAAGRDYLGKVDGPDPPLPRQANVSVTLQFVDDIVAAGGTLRLPRSKQWEFERKARLATRHRKVPDGKRLKVARVGDEIEIRLIDDEAATAELLPVDVPEKVRRHHPAARASATSANLTKSPVSSCRGRRGSSTPSRLKLSVVDGQPPRNRDACSSRRRASSSRFGCGRTA